MSEKLNVMITGASTGIGKALAWEYARHGHNLLLIARDLPKLTTLKTEIEDQCKVKVVSKSVDVCHQEQLQAAVQDAEKIFGSMHVVIANAGFGVVGAMDKLSMESIERQFDVNVFGMLKTIYAALPSLKANRGRLCLIGSTSAYLTLPGTTAYCMSKYAVRSLAEGLFVELAPSGVSVTLINPGFIKTEIRKRDIAGLLSKPSKDPIPLWMQMSSEKAAGKIYCAVKWRCRERALTGHGWIGGFLGKHFNGLVCQVMRLIFKFGKVKLPNN